ncbi:MAG: hypothetical protein ACRDGS_04710, partial [Chloroflexota bacterium]
MELYRADHTVNEAHPLLSTLRGRLPRAEKDQGAIFADELRQAIERPPFGWDGNAANVGLAILLRLSACRLLDNGKPITDPASADALRLLSKEQSFRSVRVHGVQADLEFETLKDIRDLIDDLFALKTTVVPATQHAALGTVLNDLGGRANAIAEWARTAQCPLPPSFASGRDTAGELAAIGAPTVRLGQFLAAADPLRHFVLLLGQLETFKRTHGGAYTGYRDFYTGMVNANLEIPALRAFIQNWHTVYKEATITGPDRWREIEASYNAARQAEVETAAEWRGQAEAGLAELEAALSEQARGAHVPDDQLDQEVQELATVLDHTRFRLSAPPTDVLAARAALTALQAAKLEVPRRVQALRVKYAPAGNGNVTRLGWRDLLGTTRIANVAELDAAIASLRSQIDPLI